MRFNLNLSISGLGIILYSPFAVAHFREGEDYFNGTFDDARVVAEHVCKCDISMFCTGSPGDYEIVVHDGALADLDDADFKIRLGLEIKDGKACFRDVYDLMDWTPDCPPEQKVALDDGFYRITVYSSVPSSGTIGDGQVIFLHFDKVASKPLLKWDGVPQLC